MVHHDDDDAVAHKAADLIDDLRDQLRVLEREIEDLQASLRRSNLAGIAVGVLLANQPGWTEDEAQQAWAKACGQLTRGGNTRALAAYVIQTGGLPGGNVQARI